MAYFLSLGVWPFMTAKFLLTCSGILVLLVFLCECLAHALETAS
jgi:hypothetical protein